MLHLRLATIGTLTALATALQPPLAAAQAQQNSEWFVPNQQRPAAPAVRPAQRPQPTATPPAGGPAAELAPGIPVTGEEQPTQQMQVQLPPAPEVPPLPKGPATPAAIIGILSVPDVLRISTAYQQADKEMMQRRQKLNEDAQKEQVALRDLGQQLATDRSKLTPEQIRTRERELQDRIAESRRKFGERNRIIQEASQYVMAQIERTLEMVAQQVAISRGVNLILNRAQILGTTADFDLTPQAAEVTNKVLASVEIPPDGVSPLVLHPVQPTPTASADGSTAQAAAKPAQPPAPTSKPAAPAQKR
ncbi:MAG: OmpH family outer membrane protein [Acetobacteraceae bacterium]|nr:OmpH family outer membrane protein [Acetobacteraceae bacterium]